MTFITQIDCNLRHTFPPMPETEIMLCVFRAIEDLKFQDVLSAITISGVAVEEVRCIQNKKVYQFAKEVHVTFPTHTFCTRFVNSRSLAINENSYFNLIYRPIARSLSLVFLMRLTC